MFGLKKVEIAILIALALIVVISAAPSWARTTLEHQSLEYRCGYKANLARNVIGLIQKHKAQGSPPPIISIQFDGESTVAEKELVKQYLKYIWHLSKSGVTPQDARLDTFATCMGSSQVSSGRFVTVGSVDPGVRLPPLPESQDLNYQHEWCFALAVDAKTIIQLFSKGMTPEKLHAIVETEPNFSPRHRQAVHTLIADADRARKEGRPQGLWFKQVTDACMASAHD